LNSGNFADRPEQLSLSLERFFMDKISSLMGRFSFNARVFFNGSFCTSNQIEPDGLAGQLHLVRAGPVVFSSPDGAFFQVDEPSMVFYPRGDSHRLEVPDGNTASLLCATIAFEGGTSKLLARTLPGCMRLPLSEVSTISQTMQLLFAEASNQQHGRDIVLDRLCDVLMIQVIRYQFERGYLPVGLLAGLADRQLALALAAIHERADAPRQIESLAKVACMSRARFTEHFKTVVGMPPGEYLTRWRIILAQNLMRRGLPMKTASAQAGYASPAAFSRVFTSVVGVSPRQWLRAARPTQETAADATAEKPT
jgi:AraC family transcriptional regulator, alkane utilization regulator